MTEFIPPMLAKPATRPLSDTKFWSDYVAEPKHDGMRVIVVKGANGEMAVFSRSGKVYTHHIPHLVTHLYEIMPNGSAVDGELAYIGEDSVVYSPEDICVPVVNFNKTMRVMGSLSSRAVALQETDRPLSLILFDVLHWDNVDYTSTAWIDRRIVLSDNFWQEGFNLIDAPIWINPVFSQVNNYQAYFDELTAQSVEGLVLKNLRAAYQPGKRANRTWYKVKSVKTFDVVVTGFTDGKGKYEGQIGAIKFGAYDQSGKLVEVGQCSGMDDITRRAWTSTRNSLNNDVIEIKCNELVGSGEYRTPRHPQYVRMRVDKFASECSMEQFK